MSEVKLLIALKADDTILVQISEDEKAMAHVQLEREQAKEVAHQMLALAARIPDKGRKQ